MQRTPISKPWKARFIEWLCRSGNVLDASRKAKIARSEVYAEREADPAFAAAWDEALVIATEALELEARRRAEKGVLEPIFYQGVKVGTVRRYSDSLLMFLLKAHRPAVYRENIRQELTGPGGGPIEIREVIVERLVGQGGGESESLSD